MKRSSSSSNMNDQVSKKRIIDRKVGSEDSWKQVFPLLDDLRHQLIVTQDSLKKLSSSESSFEKIISSLQDLSSLLPRIVVVGMQSSGKSSLLSRLSGFDLAVGERRTTTHLTEIRFRTSEVESQKLEILDEDGTLCQSRDEVTPDICRQVQEQLTKDLGDRLTYHRTILTLTGPHHPTYTLIDLPGLIVPQKEEDVLPYQIILSMIHEQLSSPQALILHVVEAHRDPQTIGTWKICADLDPTGQRTILALTKTDLIQGSKEQILQGWVSNYRKDEPILFYNQRFNQAKNEWISLSEEEEQDYFKVLLAINLEAEFGQNQGLPALRKRLSRKLTSCFDTVRGQIQSGCRDIQEIVRLLLQSKFGRTKLLETPAFYTFKEKVLGLSKEYFSGSKSPESFRTKINEKMSELERVLPSEWPFQEQPSLILIESEFKRRRGDVPEYLTGPYTTVQHFVQERMEELIPNFHRWLTSLQQIYQLFLKEIFSDPSLPNSSPQAVRYFEKTLKDWLVQELIKETEKILETIKNIYHRLYLSDEKNLQRGLPSDRYYHILLQVQNDLSQGQSVSQVLSFIQGEMSKQRGLAGKGHLVEIQKKIVLYWNQASLEFRTHIHRLIREFEDRLEAHIRQPFQELEEEGDYSLFQEEEEVTEARNQVLLLEKRIVSLLKAL